MAITKTVYSTNISHLEGENLAYCRLPEIDEMSQASVEMCSW
jgi:hypothetical protein